MIRDIYLGDKRFFGEVALVPISYGEGPLKDLFLKERVKMTPKEYKLHWLKKVFQEGLKIPRSIDSDFDIVEFVRREKGAVAYLPASSAAIADDIEGVLVIAKDEDRDKQKTSGLFFNRRALCLRALCVVHLYRKRAYKHDQGDRVSCAAR